MPAPGEQDLPVSPGSGHSGKNHEHQQLPEAHHHVCEIKKWDSFQWCWWTPANLPKYYSHFIAIPREKTSVKLPIHFCVCAGEQITLNSKESHQTPQLWSNSPASTPPAGFWKSWMCNFPRLIRPTADFFSINLYIFLSFDSDIHPNENLLMAYFFSIWVKDLTQVFFRNSGS